MPCHSDGYNSQDKDRLITELRKQLDLTTRLLCSICRDIEACRLIHEPSRISIKGELAEWWEIHKKKDEERNKRLNDEIKEKKIQIELLNHSIEALEAEKSQ